MKKITLIIVALLAGVTASALSLAQRADSAYNAENYREAINLYLQSIAQDGVSSDIYYNLGNAYYRNDRLGMAVVNYERALQLDPANNDARDNLNFVRSRIQDRPEDDTSFLSGVHNGIVTCMSANAWAWTTFIVFLLLVAAIGLYIFATSITLRKAGFFGGIVLIIVFLYFLVVSFDALKTATSHDRAVVTVPTTQLRSAPRAAKTTDDKVVNIHEGTVVEIVDSVPTPDDPVSPMWYNVKINNNTKAWLRSSDVERI